MLTLRYNATVLRRLLTLSSLFSLLLCLATAVLWARSYRHIDRVLWHDPQSPLYAMLYSQDGIIAIRRGVIYDPTTGNVYCLYPVTSVLLPFSSLSYQPSIPHVVVVLLTAVTPLAWLGRWFAPARRASGLLMMHGIACYLCVWPVGIAFARVMYGYPGAAAVSWTELALAPFSVPWMLALMVGMPFGLIDPPAKLFGPPRFQAVPVIVGWLSYGFALLSAWVLLVRLRRQRPGASHACAACGYNLTGNLSGICPECGTVVQLPTGPGNLDGLAYKKGGH